MKVAEGDSALLGEQVTVQALTEGEEHGLADYERDVEQVHAEAHRFVRMELLPAHKRSHKQLSQLKQALY